MANHEFNHISLLGRLVTFVDEAQKRHMAELDLPPDYPEEFKSCIVSGIVQGFNILFEHPGKVTFSLLLQDSFYDLDDISGLLIDQPPKG